MKKNSMKKPNIVYILADDMGYGDVSFLNPQCAFETPNLDDICRRGIHFEDAHASSAVCTPSRYNILTGRYNWRSKLKSSVLGGYSGPILEPNRKTIANVLQSVGYKTAAIGKWHLGMDFAKSDEYVEPEGLEMAEGIEYGKKIDNAPTDFGFDYFYGIAGSLDMPPYIYIENDHFTHFPNRITKASGKGFWREGPTAPDFVHDQVLDKLTYKVLDKIDEYQEEPFFIYFPMPAPHTPILPAEKFQGKSNTNEYGDFVLHCDDVVGRINTKLKELGIDQNTIVIFTADNGCSPQVDFKQLMEYGHNPNYKFRGAKADIYEGGHRVPLLIKWPSQIEENQRCREMVCLGDLLATIAEYLEIQLEDNVGEDSISNLSLWLEKDKEPVRDYLVQQSINGSLAIRCGAFKLEMCKGSGGWAAPAPGQERADAPEYQLYNLAEDIGECHNIINEHPKLTMMLQEKLCEIIANGRSTTGSKQSNTGDQTWPAIKWYDDMQKNI